MRRCGEECPLGLDIDGQYIDMRCTRDSGHNGDHEALVPDSRELWRWKRDV